MNRNRFRRQRTASLALLLGTGTICQLSGCDFGQVTTSVTLDGRELVISLVRGALLQPLDALITEAINDAFDDE